MIKYKNIAIIKSGAIGDVLMTTPFLRCLRKTFPKAKITYILGNWSESALEGNPDMDRIITFDENIIFKTFLPFKLLKLWKLSGRVRKEKFDLCFVMDKSYLAGIFAWFSGIPERVGFARGWEGFMHTKTVKYEKVKHEIQYYIDLLVYFTKKKCDKKMIMSIKEEQRKIAGRISRWKGTKKLIGIAVTGGNPGQSSKPRDWPIENFSKLIAIASKKNWKFVILGINGSLYGKNIYDLTGKTSLKEAAAVIDVCDAFVTADNGLMHVASAVNTPIVSIFGITDPRRKAPLNAGSIYLWKGSACTKCELYGRYCSNHPSASEITPESVMKELDAIV